MNCDDQRPRTHPLRVDVNINDTQLDTRLSIDFLDPNHEIRYLRYTWRREMFGDTRHRSARMKTSTGLSGGKNNFRLVKEARISSSICRSESLPSLLNSTNDRARYLPMERLARIGEESREQEGNIASKIIRARRVVGVSWHVRNPVYRITPEEGGGGGGGINLLLLKQDCFLRSRDKADRSFDSSSSSPPPHYRLTVRFFLVRRIDERNDRRRFPFRFEYKKDSTLRGRDRRSINYHIVSKRGGENQGSSR